MLLKPAAAQAVSEVSKKKPGPRPGGDSTTGGTALKRPAPRRLPIAPRRSLLRAQVPSDRGLRRSFLSLRPSPRRGTAAGGSAPERLAPRRRIPAIAKAHPEAWSSRTTAFGSVLSLPLGGAVPERTAPRHRRTLGHHRTAAPLSRGQPRAGARAWSARTTASGSNRPRRTPFRFALQLRRSQHERFQSPPRDSKLRRTRISKDVTRTRERAARNPDTGARGKTMA